MTNERHIKGSKWLTKYTFEDSFAFLILLGTKITAQYISGTKVAIYTSKKSHIAWKII